MRRNKGQVLFRYLPTMFVDYGNNHAIVRISKWDCNCLDDVISKTRIVQKIQRSARKFDHSKFPHSAGPEAYTFLEPRKIEAVADPLTFVCSNPLCQRVVHAYSPEKALMATNYLKCTRCKSGKMLQLDLIYSHTCGVCESIRPVTCRDHPGETYLYQQGKIGYWRWRCRKCDHSISLNKRCPNDGEMMYPVPFRKSSVMYPLSETFINISKETEEVLSRNPDYARLKVAEYLGLVSKHAADMEALLRLKGTSQDRINLENTIKRLKEFGIDDEKIRAISKTVKDENPSDEDKKEVILKELSSLIDFSDEEYSAHASAIIEFEEAAKVENKKSLTEVISDAEAGSRQNLPKVRRFPEVLKRIGVTNAFAVGDLSVLTSVWGFIRKKTDPKSAVLNPFSATDETNGKIPVYSSLTYTEGMVLEFDRARILRWIKSNMPKAVIPDENDEMAQKAWFLKNMQLNSIESVAEIPDDEISRVTKLVYTLLHSISHALILRATVQSGFDKDSMGELIFPTIPAIIIYCKNTDNYQLGGMFSLFENGIIPWIDETEKKVERCIYDPVCMLSNNGACHACMFLSERSCAHFNKDLSRAHLIGRKEDAGSEIKGFWEQRG